MMDNEFHPASFAFVIGMVIGLLLGGWLHSTTYQHQAIERGYALYDPQTGEWRWLDDKGDE